MTKTLILGWIALSLFSSCSDNQAAVSGLTPAPQLPVLQLTTQTAHTQSEYPASLQGVANVEIRPQVSGQLLRVWVDEGDYVKQGQVLFTIDPQVYQEQLSNAQAGLQAATAAVANAQLEVDRLTPLVSNNVVSDYQLKSAQAALKLAVAKEAQAKAAVGSAQINLGYTSVKAPVSGYIGQLPRKQGSLVSATDPEPLTMLSDVHNIRAYFSLGERDFIRFKSKFQGSTLDDKVHNLPPVELVLADGSIYPEKGRIDMIDGQFDPNTAAITVRATFPNNNGLLRSGNTGKVQLGLEHDSTLLVPQSATVEIQDKVFVYAVDSTNKVARQPIVITGRTGTDYLVQSGVKPGDRIVLKGFDNLQDGAVIQPVSGE